MIAVIATILGLRFKSVNIQTETSVSIALTMINKLWPSTSPPIPSQKSEDEDDADNIWSFHDKIASKRQHVESNTRSGLSSKLKIYLKAPLENRKEDPLRIWSQIQNSYWEVSQIALIYLSIPATSVPGWRLFSKAGSTITQKRSSMKPDTLNKLLFLNSLHLDELKMF